MERGAPRLVPWSNWEEWLQVYQSLFSAKLEERWFGIKKVSAWKVRGKVPVAIDSTCSFLELAIRDEQSHNSEGFKSCWNFESGSRNENELRMSHSIAIIRFVNGIVDKGQKGAFAVSITQLADRIGLPRFFVDLRHEATHNQLPSMVVLRAARNQALEWLNSNYWQKQYQSSFENKNNIVQLLKKFRKLQKGGVNDESKLDTEEAIECLWCIGDYISPNSVRETLIPLLLNSNFLVPRSKKQKEYTTLPARFIKVWRIAFEKFSSFWPHFIPILVLRMIQEVSGTNSKLGEDDEDNIEIRHRNSILTNWVMYLLRSFGSTDEGVLSISQTTVRAIIESCVSSYHSKGSRRILDKIFDLFPQSTDFAKKMRKIGSFAQSASNISNKKMKLKPLESDLSLEALQNRMQKQLESEESLQSSPVIEKTNNEWSASDKQWNDVPIGLLPDGTFPNLDLSVLLDNFSNVLVPKTFQQQSSPQEQTTDGVVSMKRKVPLPDLVKLSKKSKHTNE
eukprot:TRINITY_DN1314_c0_g1_i1.p1 TRINITY_DN1314_c0_g1~~TRINITY_DN1314_c0_g1_i1.p1  ORF type:complete len:521 (+),score=84.12 TRINITY_DN1314_c0_g1_i1:40-1563(+)